MALTINSAQYNSGADYETVTGDIVTINNAKPYVRMKQVVCEINPVQDLHGYDNPWPAGGGKNLFNGTFLQGYWAYANGVFVGSNEWVTTSKIPCKPSTAYTVSSDTRLTRWQGFVWYDSNDAYISTDNLQQNTNIGLTKTSPANAAYMVFNIAESSSGEHISPSDVTHFQLEEGSSATTWTPYSNECPISGWSEAKVTRCGKNFLPNVVENRSESYGITVDFLGDGEFHIYGTTTNNYSYAYFTLERPCIINVNYFHANNDATYGTTKCAISLRNGSTLVQDIWLNSVNTVGEIMPTNIGKQFTRIMFATPTNYTVDYTCKLMLSANANDAYEPYKGQTVTIDLGSTRYGGVLDVTKGKLTVTKENVVFDGSSSNHWTKVANYGSVTRFDYTGLQIKPASGANLLTNMLKLGTIGTSNLECCNVHGSTSVLQIQIDISRLASDDVTGLMGFLSENNLQVCYELATPVEVDVDQTTIKTLLGTNNVWADCGDIEVQYCCDSRLFIEKKLGLL